VVVKALQKPRKHRPHNFGFSIGQKIYMCERAIAVKSIRGTAREFGWTQANIQYGIKNLENYKRKARIRPTAKTANKGRVPTDIELEEKVNLWYEELEMDDIPVKTDNIIAYAISLDNKFKEGNKKLLQDWVYRFMKRYDLTLRRVTHRGQKLSGHLNAIRIDTATAINKRFSKSGSMYGLNPKYFLNMDQTAVYFESKSSVVVSPKGKRSVPMRDSGSDAKRATIVVTISAAGDKLEPFFIFKGQPDKKVEQSLEALGIKGCAQPKGWFDSGVAQKWIEQILEPYVADTDKAYLLCDHFSVHLTSDFLGSCNSLGVEV
jgi:Tc5 transposase DNA-binding domain/DDE superfamily endonuclease